jgi:hypothetical protein
VEAPSYLNTSGAGKSTARERLSIHQNPAALRSSNYGLSLNTYHPFGLKDMRISHGGLYWDWVRVGLSLNWLHTDAASIYRENIFQIQSSWKFHSKWNIGVSLSQEHLQLAGLGQSFGNSLSAGILWSAHPQITLGMYGKNIWIHGFLASETSTSVHWGTSLKSPSQRIVLFLDFTHITHYVAPAHAFWKPWKYHIGKQIRFFPSFWVYGGFQNKPYQLAFGIRLSWEGWAIQHSTSFQRLLGKTFHYGIRFSRSRE